MCGNNKDMEEYLKHINSCGWFNEWPKDKVKKKLASIRTFNEGMDPWIALADINEDFEGIYDEGCYAELVQAFADGSAGLFTPTQIEESWQENKVTIRFNYNSRAIQKTWKQNDDWISRAFINLMLKVVNEAVAPLEMQMISGEGQEWILVLTTKLAFNKAKKAGLIPGPLFNRMKREAREADTEINFSNWGKSVVFTSDNRVVVTEECYDNTSKKRDRAWMFDALAGSFVKRMAFSGADPSCLVSCPQIVSASFYQEPLFLDFDSEETESLEIRKQCQNNRNSGTAPELYIKDIDRWYTRRLLKSPNSKTLYCLSSSDIQEEGFKWAIHCIDITTKRLLRTFSLCWGFIDTACIGAINGEMAWVDRGNASVIQVMCLETGKIVRTINIENKAVCIDWSSDENMFAVLYDGGIKFIHSETGKEHGVCENVPTSGQNKQDEIRFSVDGKYAVTWGGYDGSINVWNCPAGKFIKTLQCHSYGTRINCLAFAPNGKRIATAGSPKGGMLLGWPSLDIISPLSGVEKN